MICNKDDDISIIVDAHNYPNNLNESSFFILIMKEERLRFFHWWGKETFNY